MTWINASLKLGDILLPRERINERVAEIAGDISREYAGERVVVVGVLKGAVIFMADLVRVIDDSVDVRMDFMAVSSYGDSSTSSGAVKIIKDMDTFAEDEHIILVEDIMDTGLTLSYLKEMLMTRNPRSFKTCVLLEKPERKKAECAIDYRGFEIPDKFVVGYGLDYAGKWRNLSDIWHVVEG
ncbi:MAG: hypoxanthine phosphoribosyltransferase [Synergistaceae bacterium]|jgi:hypoxanthine phosphoribosyltransferase|nr:hypoxanthine phosphoribosyltransferase [Synergistaceae bacterium]